MANLQGFSMGNARDFGPKVDIIAPGWCKVVILKDELSDTKNGAKRREKNKAAGLEDTSLGVDQKLVITLETQDGTSRTSKVRLNVLNQNEVAQRIGLGELAAIAEAIGHKGSYQNTVVLYGRPFEAKFEIEKYKDEMGKDRESNKVVAYRPVQSTVSAPASGAPAPW